MRWTHDDLVWRELGGSTQVGRLPDAFAQALAAVPDDGLTALGRRWHARLCAEFPGDWTGDDAGTLLTEVADLRGQAQKALADAGALWLRIEL